MGKINSVTIKIALGVFLGIFVGSFVTPIFNQEGFILNLLISTILVIFLWNIIETIITELSTMKVKSIILPPLQNLYRSKVSEIDQAAITLADAFKNDPLFKKIVGNDTNASKKYLAMAKFVLKYCYKYGFVYATSEKFEGVMAITQDKYTYQTLWRIFRSGGILYLPQIGIKSLMLIPALEPLEQMRKKYMKSRSYIYIQIIGVGSDYQGKGHGGKLLRELIATADKQKQPIYLETETLENVELYKHFGFEVIENIKLATINQEMWTMIREGS